MLLCIAVPHLSAQGIEGKVAACAACHGDNGLPKIPEAPILWGQQAGNLYIELRDFKSGARKSDIMQPQVANLEDADMVAIAKYFAAKPWPHTGYQASDADRTAGERINQSGMCTQCHLGGFVGDGTIPRIGGQTETYLRKTMLDFKT